MLDLERVPVIVGVGRRTLRNEQEGKFTGPFELMAECSRLAAEDAGVPSPHALLASLDAVRDTKLRDPFLPSSFLSSRLPFFSFIPSFRNNTTWELPLLLLLLLPRLLVLSQELALPWMQ
jgi:hypothetical protein